MAINFFNTPPPTRQPAKESGFTLVELMVVVAIIAVIGAIAIPNLSPANARLKQASRDLYGNLQRMRTEAVKTNQDVGIVFDTANNQYILCQNADTNNTCSDLVGADGQTPETIITTISLTSYGSTVQYGCGAATQSVTGGACPGSGVSYGGSSVVFTPEGRVRTMGYVYLQNNRNSSYTVGTPSLAGVVKMRKWTNTSWE